MQKPKVSQQAATTLDLPRVPSRASPRVAAPQAVIITPPPPDSDDAAASLSAEEVEATDYIDETLAADAPHQTTFELRPLGARVAAQPQETQRELIALPDGLHRDTTPTVPMVRPVPRAR